MRRKVDVNIDVLSLSSDSTSRLNLGGCINTEMQKIKYRVLRDY